MPFSFFGMCVFFVFLILCALCFQSPIGNSLVLKSPSSFSPRGKSTRGICRLLLDSPLDRKKKKKKKIKIFPVTAKYCSRVLYLGWWCYTGGGRGESSTPKQCKAIWVLTKALKRIEKKKKKINIWSSILIGTAAEVASSDWPMGLCLGWGWKETPLSSRLLWLS